MEKNALTYTLEIERHEDGYLAYFPALPGRNSWRLGSIVNETGRIDD